jgi:hypothetical protein
MKINLFVFLIFCFQISLAQEVNIVKLNDKIYEYNNNLEYKKSKDTLLHLLSNENLTAHDQIEINILLSMTYKRLQDYKSVLLSVCSETGGQFHPKLGGQFERFFHSNHCRKHRKNR